MDNSYMELCSKAALAVFSSVIFSSPKLAYTKRKQYQHVFGSIFHLEHYN